MYPYRISTRPTNRKAMLPDMLARVFMLWSEEYTSRAGVMKNRDSRTMMNPSGTRNLFLLPGSDSILVMM